MKFRAMLLVLTFVGPLVSPTRMSAQSSEIAFESITVRDLTIVSGTGFQQLPALLSRVIHPIYRFDGGDPIATSWATRKRKTPSPAVAIPTALDARAYQSRVESDNNGILALENGAVVEVTSGYVGYLGYRRRVILFLTDASCRIAIAGKRTLRCTVLRAPTIGRPQFVEMVYLSEVLDRGAILVLTDGRILEIDAIGRIYTGLWLPVSELAILDGIEVANLGSAGEPVRISRVR